ncbi:MAG TPA: ATP-grasp domain-containing protein [Candidatus Methylacidiphilales bacterium]|nr:ATP-grasp domain-containing protein [Candidatus Methylacidiphilales bacterium]
MCTLILPARHSSDYTALYEAAIGLKWKVARWPLKPPFPRLRGEVVFYGDPFTAALLESETKVCFEVPPFDWLSGLDFQWIKRRVCLGPLHDFELLRKTVSHNAESVFVKPAGDKVFPAGVRVALNSVETDGLDGETPILVSEVMDFSQEWRFFIRQRTIETYSIYARDGVPFKGRWVWEQEDEDAAVDFMHAFLQSCRASLLPSQVIDIGLTSKGWAIVETNEAWASGLYACDPVGVLTALRASSLQL